MKMPQPTMQAPDAPAGSLAAEKKKRADHELLNAAGEVVENEEDANGIRYTLLALPDQPFTYQYGTNPVTDKFLAIFGAKTLATNESSAVRNDPKGAGTAEEQIDAVTGRFALLGTGKWVDRTREGVGAKIDLDVFANAMCNVLVSEGVYTEEQVKTEKLAKTREALENKETLAKARKVPTFAAEYARLRGAATASTSDFAL